MHSDSHEIVHKLDEATTNSTALILREAACAYVMVA